MLMDVVSCRRCGGGHQDLDFQPLNNPADEWTHWAMCPTTGQPVIISPSGSASSPILLQCRMAGGVLGFDVHCQHGIRPRDAFELAVGIARRLCINLILHLEGDVSLWVYPNSTADALETNYKLRREHLGK